jgi:hypothetical protein
MYPKQLDERPTIRIFSKAISNHQSRDTSSGNNQHISMSHCRMEGKSPNYDVVVTIEDSGIKVARVQTQRRNKGEEGESEKND